MLEKLKKITKQIDLLACYIIFNILYILVGGFSFVVMIKNNQYFAFGLIALFSLNVIVISIIALMGKYKKDILHLFMLLAVMFGGISIIFAPKIIYAVFGFVERYEGFVVILYYISLMFLCTFVKENHKKIIVNFIVITGLIQCAYALCQIYDLKVEKMSFINIHVNNVEGAEETTFYNKVIWATGFTNNPNFFGTYMLLCLSYSIGLFIDEKNIKKAIYYAFTTLFLTIGLLISNTASCAIGFICVILYIIVFCIKNKKIKKLFIAFLIILCSVVFTVKANKTTLIKDISNTQKETTEIVKGNSDDNFGSGRLFVWKETLKIMPKYWLHGVGIDNLYYAFDGGPLYMPNAAVFFDKAHNEYLHIAVTEGIFSLISYLIIYTIVGVRSLKNSFESKQTYLILPIIGYLVQAFFNIRVIEVAPIFFIALGLAANKKLKSKDESVKK